MKIYIIGAGSFGTAIANQLVQNNENEIFLVCKKPEQLKEISSTRINSKYFPNYKIENRIKVIGMPESFKSKDLVLIAIPSGKIESFFGKNSSLFVNKPLIANLSKGFTVSGHTITSYLEDILKMESIINFKGGTFASEMMLNNHSYFTLGYRNVHQYEIFKSITYHTNIYFDFTKDVLGVELLSILKNVYAIFIGLIDAKYNSANTRHMFLTKALEEIRLLLKILGGNEESLYLSCGVGDFTLTALNDLSRNRTFGLLLGKGFFNGCKGNSVLVEGIRSINIIDKKIPAELRNKLPIFHTISEVAHTENKIPEINFQNLLQRKMNTVLTYGTFDLLHYGHIEILRKAKEYGDRLIVGLSTDEFNLIKGKECVFPYEKRKKFLETLEFVDEVIPENSWNQKKSDIKEFDVDFFIMGDDWREKFDYLNDICKVKYLPRTKGISTTQLKQLL